MLNIGQVPEVFFNRTNKLNIVSLKDLFLSNSLYFKVIAVNTTVIK